MMSSMEFQNDLDKLLAVMPPKVTSFITIESLNDVIEIVLDIGRPPEIRHSGGKIEKLGSEIVNDEDIIMLYRGFRTSLMTIVLVFPEHFTV